MFIFKTIGWALLGLLCQAIALYNVFLAGRADGAGHPVSGWALFVFLISVALLALVIYRAFLSEMTKALESEKRRMMYAPSDYQTRVV